VSVRVHECNSRVLHRFGNDILQVNNSVMLCVCCACEDGQKGGIIICGGWLRTGERNYKRSSHGLSKGVESLEDTRRFHDRDARWRPLFSGLRGPSCQDLSCTLLEGKDY